MGSCCALAIVFSCAALGQESSVAQEAAAILEVAPPATEVLLLSGRGPADAVAWEFEIDSGRRAGERTALPVPSHWQQHGFGTYLYGQQSGDSSEKGTYRRDVEIPALWRGRRIELVFGGSMTDTTAFLDGEPVGATHRGGFTEFRYDVSEMLHAGSTHSLEVQVDAHSSNRSVNAAERRADYWLFGGIYRPVWLEARPPENLRIISVNAHFDGQLELRVACDVESTRDLQARILPRATISQPPRDPLGQLSGTCEPDRVAKLSGQIDGVRPWSAEEPNLYGLELTLWSAKQPTGTERREILHRAEQSLGFRTVEVREDGFYVNHERTVLKGINRHSFWPATGRALDPQRNVEDVRLLRSLNFNAVRTAHSPPDPAFLDACDELGLFVLAEFPGWHDAYDTEVGRQLIAEMLQRDQHHPSIVLWSNGNEGGWNRTLDREFALHDPQQRPVVHPWSTFGGFATTHYPTWSGLQRMLDDDALEQRLARARFGQLPLVLPTELLHALYDGGGAAGLQAYWRLLSASRRFAGAFLWSLFDEGLVRSDRDGELDTFGNHAADGILDPWRRPEASAGGVREIFAPVSAELSGSRDEPAVVTLHNGYDHLDLEAVEVRYAWLRLPLPLAEETRVDQLAAGSLRAPRAPPGGSATFALPLPPTLDELPPEALQLILRRADRPDEPPFAEAVFERDPPAVRIPPLAAAALEPFELLSGDPLLEVAVGATRIAFDEEGNLVHFLHAGQASGLSGGHQIRAGVLASAPPFDTSAPEAKSSAGVAKISLPTARRQLTAQLAPHGFLPTDTSAAPPTTEQPHSLRLRFAAPGGTVRTWLIRRDGWVRLHLFAPAGIATTADGLHLDLAGQCEASLAWLGRGPFPVWGNRRTGAFGSWEQPRRSLCRANAAPDGPATTAPRAAGLYDARWLRLDLPNGTLTVVPGSGELLGIGHVSFPGDARNARAEIPEGLTIWREPPEIGTKFHPPALLQGPRTPNSIHLSVWLHFSASRADARSPTAVGPEDSR